MRSEDDEEGEYQRVDRVWDCGEVDKNTGCLLLNFPSFGFCIGEEGGRNSSFKMGDGAPQE